MTPEMRLKSGTVLTESARVKDALLAVQTEVDAVAQQTEVNLLGNIREQLCYKPVPAVSEEGLVDARIAEKTPVITPKALGTVLPLSRASARTTRKGREAIGSILRHEDNRLIAIVGPCSIHDPEAALKYAEQVKGWRAELGSELEIVMRAYMEKPRTERGWKGFIYDPLLDESDDINLGVVATRMTACQITHRGVPLAMERLNALTPQYVNGLVAYDAIGARNTTDQKAREYASGTSSPVGFKNTPEGDVLAAVQAVVSANGAHAFLGMGMNGTPYQINTTGNDTAHIILRGAQTGPNFSKEHIHKVKRLMRSRGLLDSIIVDASHDNSGKKANRQRFVIGDVSAQIQAGETAIRGVMIESNLVGGRQKFVAGGELTPGQSITDECSGLIQTENMLRTLAEAVRVRKQRLAQGL